MAIGGFGIKDQIFVPKVPSLIMSYYYSKEVRRKENITSKEKKMDVLIEACFVFVQVRGVIYRAGLCYNR